MIEYIIFKLSNGQKTIELTYEETKELYHNLHELLGPPSYPVPSWSDVDDSTGPVTCNTDSMISSGATEINSGIYTLRNIC